MYEKSLVIHEMPEVDTISLILHTDDEPMLALGERITARFDEA